MFINRLSALNTKLFCLCLSVFWLIFMWLCIGWLVTRNIQMMTIRARYLLIRRIYVCHSYTNSQSTIEPIYLLNQQCKNINRFLLFIQCTWTCRIYIHCFLFLRCRVMSSSFLSGDIFTNTLIYHNLHLVSHEKQQQQQEQQEQTTTKRKEKNRAKRKIATEDANNNNNGNINNGNQRQWDGRMSFLLGNSYSFVDLLMRNEKFLHPHTHSYSHIH